MESIQIHGLKYFSDGRGMWIYCYHFTHLDALTPSRLRRLKTSRQRNESAVVSIFRRMLRKNLKFRVSNKSYDNSFIHSFIHSTPGVTGLYWSLSENSYSKRQEIHLDNMQTPHSRTLNPEPWGLTSDIPAVRSLLPAEPLLWQLIMSCKGKTTSINIFRMWINSKTCKTYRLINLITIKCNSLILLSRMPKVLQCKCSSCCKI